MGNGSPRTRWESALDAVDSVLETLTANDYATIVLFNNAAVSYSSRLVRADAQERTKMAQWVRGQAPDGDTDFSAGLGLAYDILAASEAVIGDVTSSSGCHTALLFMTDGVHDPNNVSTLQPPLALVNERQADHPSVIFAYSFGEESSGDLPKQLACASGGVWVKVHDFDAAELRTAMSHYYSYFAALNRQGGEK